MAARVSRGRRGQQSVRKPYPWNHQTWRFPGEWIQSKDSHKPLPTPHPPERRLAVGPGGSVKGRHRLYLTRLIVKTGGERLPSDHTYCGQVLLGPNHYGLVDPSLADAPWLMHSQRFGCCQASCGLGLEEASRV